MWTCPYCGGTNGIPFHDEQLDGVLCLEADCGRFVDNEELYTDAIRQWDDTDF
ncbi:hypothetical protein ACAF76_009040 [Brevibacillus sp. TJ4]|uniref:hypothetical protein n=1 Tax=Brevibacillus sp. TJ4 TaxID=3234853 RepID=UPI0037D23E20